MRKFYRISGNVESPLAHMAASVVLSFLVMMFVNVFIGGMGGIPVFAAFLMQFYFLRAVAIAGNRISHQLAMDSGAEVLYYFANYAAGYLLVWAGMKILILLSHISGWGNIGGMAFGEYMDRIYGSTMLERWSYLFAGILMFAYVMSLFPLVLIRRKKEWLLYLLADTAVFVAVCEAIMLICRFSVAESKRRWVQCVLDGLLLCELPKEWEAVCYLAALVFFAVLAVVAAYRISLRAYGPKPGVMEWKELEVMEWKKPGVRGSKDYHPIIMVISVVVVTLVLVVAYFLFGQKEYPAKYDKAAEFLTEDSVLGPMVFEGAVYVPVDAEWDLKENGEELGYLCYKDEDCGTRFYELLIGNLLYRDLSVGEDYLQMQGADFASFEREGRLQEEKRWEDDTVFLLWDEDWVSQTALSNATGYTVCSQELVYALMEEYPDARCNPSDFADYDAYFSIRSYVDMKEAYESDINIGNWAGCILVKDNKFYYCNYKNPITGVYLQQLLDELGGNQKKKKENE